jgi:cytochrome bd-type quinol oxidase subunit 2
VSLYFFRHSLVFNLIRMFGYHGSADLSVCFGRMSPYTVSGREKECTEMFISMFSAIWDQRQMFFVLLYGFIPDSFER